MEKERAPKTRPNHVNLLFSVVVLGGTASVRAKTKSPTQQQRKDVAGYYIFHLTRAHREKREHLLSSHGKSDLDFVALHNK